MRKHFEIYRIFITFMFVSAVIFFAALNSAWGESDKYRLVWTDDPATTMVVGWCQVSGSDPHVMYGLSPDKTDWVRKEIDAVTLYSNPGDGADPPVLSSNFVQLAGLLPDTAYFFTVSDSDGDSPVIWFKTAPAAPQAITFIAGGDSRTNEVPRTDGNRLIAKIRPLFIAHGGDFLDNGTYDEWQQWLDEWQLTRSSDGRMYPIVPCHGNHENDVTDMLAKIFNISNPDAYYALNIGGNMMRLYTLNSELEPGVGYGAFSGQTDVKWNAQTAWLAAEMSDPANDSVWKIANYHRPMRPHTSAKTEGTGRIAAWADNFYNGGVDLAVECDTHMVKYTYPLKPDEGEGSFQSFIRDDLNGTVFIGEGSWGAPKRPVDDDKPWTLASDSFWQFKLIHAGPESLNIRTIRFEDTASVDAVVSLTQTEQDNDPFALPENLDLWNPLAGSVLALPFTGADVNNMQFVGTRGQWKYLDDGIDQGSAWKETLFDDSSWSADYAQFGYGDGDEDTILSYGPDPDNKYITYYFRKEFNVTDPSKVIKLNLWLMRDDGAVVYINGMEVLRSNMPEGEIFFSTLAAGSVGGSEESIFREIPILPETPVLGVNTIAVEIHQSAQTSSDISFDLDLTGILSGVTGSVPATPTGLAATPLSTSEIEISWLDQSDDEAGYELQRKTGSGSWEIHEGRLPADTSVFNDTMLPEGGEYSYRVRAYNAAGLSVYSNEVSAATLTNPVPVIYSEDFESGTLGEMNSVSVASNHDWHVYEYYGSHFAKINGYGADVASDDWLITKSFNLNFYTDETISFETAYNYSGPELEVFISTDYDPDLHTDPQDAVWENLNPVLPSEGGYSFVNSGLIDLSSYNADTVHIAFHYYSTGAGGGDGRIWEVDNIELRGTYSPPVIASEDFENNTLGSFIPYSRSSSAEWHPETRAGQLGAFCNGYGSDEPSDDWMIYPAGNITPEDYAKLSFDLYSKYSGPDLEVKISVNYSGTGDPMEAGVIWEDINVDYSLVVEDQWVTFDQLDISGYTGSNVFIAFRYLSTGTGPGDGRLWGIDNFKITKSLPGTVSVNFTANPTEVTTAEAVSFLPFVTGGNAPYTYFWDFGNGETSNEEKPLYTYIVPGDYTVTLTVDDSSGNQGDKVRANYITVVQATEEPIPPKSADLRIATFNVLFAFAEASGQGRLINNLSDGNWDQAKKVAEIIQRINPDVILLNEFDYDEQGQALLLFKNNYLAVSQNGADPILFDYDFIAPANTGVPSGKDFNNDGDTDDPEDCFGYGYYPGAYGMAVLSKFPVISDQVRTFQNFLWKDMPDNLLPTGYYSEDAREVFRLSSKSHWDVPVQVNGETVHLLASHPTPPVFDGAEDRNGRRNHDEIRFWGDYVTPGQDSYISDDNGVFGGLGADTRFVIMGDQNADPYDGDSTDNAIWQLLGNANISAAFEPVSSGAIEESDDATDTASWGLRADYVLPSVFETEIEQGGVFWPVATDILYRLVKNDGSSDHRLVWLDLWVKLPGDLDGDGDIDRYDIAIIRLHLNQSAAECPDCDIDGDGVITILDARKLVTMCTCPRCLCE